MLSTTSPTSPNHYLCRKQKGVILYRALNLENIYVVYAFNIHILLGLYLLDIIIYLYFIYLLKTRKTNGKVMKTDSQTH